MSKTLIGRVGRGSQVLSSLGDVHHDRDSFVVAVALTQLALLFLPHLRAKNTGYSLVAKRQVTSTKFSWKGG